LVSYYSNQNLRMKKIFFLFMLIAAFFACKKDNTTLPAGAQTISGVLLYSDPDVDGGGLTYVTDSGETILFKNEFTDYYTQYLNYRNFVGVHSLLTFTDTGATGCSLSEIADYCAQHPMRVVQVFRLVKE
jgi:hypothetical protein